MNLKRELEKMKKEDLQWIFKEIYNKMTQKNKKVIIKLLLKPLFTKYRKNIKKIYPFNCKICNSLLHSISNDPFKDKQKKMCDDCKTIIELEQQQKEEQQQEIFQHVNDDIPEFIANA